MKDRNKFIATMLFSVFAMSIALSFNAQVSNEMKLGLIMFTIAYSIFQILSYLFVFRGYAND
jgi:hypothetical protein